MSIITAVETPDIRFPTSRNLDGSDAMNTDPDYSAAYLRIITDADDGHAYPGGPAWALGTEAVAG